MGKKTYEESEEVKAAKAAADAHAATKPEAYQSKWQQGLSDTLDKILNREKFTYDLGSDALYRQYKDRYVQQGRLAMEDTVGRVSALTGGYGNSYAQQAGQQAYHGYLQGLTDKIPELYALALETYDREGKDLRDRYDLMNRAEDDAYSRYRDYYSAWEAEGDRLYNLYTGARDFDYNAFLADRDHELALERAAEADRQWQAEFDENLRRYNEVQASKKGGGGGSGGKKLTDAQLKQIIAYGDAGNYKGLNIYLTSLENHGYLTGEEKDWIYGEYVKPATSGFPSDYPGFVGTLKKNHTKK